MKKLGLFELLKENSSFRVFFIGEVFAVVLAIIGVINDFIKMNQSPIELMANLMLAPTILTILWIIFFGIGWGDEIR